MTDPPAAEKDEGTKKRSLLAAIREKRNKPICCPGFRLLHLLFLLLVLAAIPTIALSLYFSLRHRSYALGPAVDLGYSRYRGVQGKDGITRWLGVRFARPPTGQYRFAAPAEPVADGKTHDASEAGPVCISARTKLDNATSKLESEDCLYLNVYAPTAAKTGDNLPVYVFIQGGGFNGNANANMDGGGIIKAADMKAVVVNFNYRAAAYGFLASKEMADTNNDYAYNIGLLDQRQALIWVSMYISRFGGNPEHVTLGGASAGGGSVVLQLTAYGGRDDELFHAVAAESQAFPVLRTVEQSEFMFEALAGNAGCHQSTAKERLSCLRQMPVNDFQRAHALTNGPYPHAKGEPLWYWGPTLDKDFIQDYTYNQLRDGKFVQVPGIFGDSTHEGTIFTPGGLENQTAADAFMQDNFPALTTEQLAELHKVFPHNTKEPGTAEWHDYAADMFGMTRYICPGIFIMNAYAKGGVQSIYNYRWDSQHATHVAELGAVWGGGPTPPQQAVHRHFVSFIRSYDPNSLSGGEPKWEPWGGVNGNNRILYANETVSMEKVDNATLEKCKVLHSIAASIGQ